MKILEEKDIIIGKKYHWINDYSDYQPYTDTDVTVLRELEDGKEVDKSEVGAMYEVLTYDGKKLAAYLDELSKI